MSRKTTLLVALLLSGSCGSAFGQNILTEKVLSLNLAQMIAQAAVDKCRAEGMHITATVVDTSGLVKVTLRDDGTAPETIEVSKQKAYTAMLYKRKTSETLKIFNPWPGIEGTIPLPGGIPILVGDEIVGGLGVSGGRDDEVCGDAAIEKFASLLK